ncbi:HvfC/BufC N-terminal domain-containing protein [Inhella proteolytica]|uniref:DNA-binding domain-containing protein n=1 Tax=Inhella proteolytica TaxID=2795029 RepID=A0A931NDM2_9BURK|nr:DNA-binding domain-containing protein [Inhella proteolytica]MBH9576812.1 putative DNA-binding domain-containing protein [Inhella proteolytica]
MKTLAQIQATLQHAVRAGEPAPDGLLRGSAQGLAIYQHAYRARLREALADNHPALAQAVGDKGFAALAAAYLEAEPPTEPSIRWYGHRLAAFMDGWAELPHPALADLARLDWALRQAFDAAAHPLLGPSELAALRPDEWADLRLRLQPSVQRLDLHWAVGPAWHALNAARAAGQEAELSEPQARAHSLLVWRSGLQPHWRSLAEDEAAALQALLQEPALADWLAAQGEAALPQAVGWLQAWSAEGLLAVA